MEPQRYSHSIFIHVPGTDRVRKIIEPDAALCEGERRDLGDAMRGYHAKLAAMGLALPEPYRVVEEEGWLIEVSQFCGPDGFALIAYGGNGAYAADVIVREIVAAIRPVLCQPRGAWEVTVDAHPSNWCFMERGRYVDFFPARHRWGGAAIVGFPPPAVGSEEYVCAYRRYYSAEGVLRALRFSVIRAGGAALEPAFRDALAVLPDSLRRELLAFFDDLPAVRLGRGATVAETLEGLDIRHIDDIREVAMHVVSCGFSAAEAREFLNTVLDLTVGDFRIPLQARIEKMEQAKRFIIAEARSRGIA